MHPKIRRMVKKMAAQEANRKRKPDGGWFLYILRCKDNTLYTGVTKDLKRRLKMHNGGRGSRYTRARRPVSQVYYECCASRAQALVREYKVKALPRKEKEKLILNGKKSLKQGRRHG